MCFPLGFSMCFEKLLCMALYSLKMGGLEWLPNDMGFIPNLTLNTEKHVFHSFWNPSMRAQARVCVRMNETCTRSFGTCMGKRMYAYACPRVSRP